MQPDGRLLAIGTARMPDDPQNSDVALARYEADGSLDPTFGDGGRVVSDLAGGQNDAASSGALDPAGELVVAGWAVGDTSDVLVARYRTAGAAPRQDPPGQTGANRCVAWSGVDLNELFGVDEQLVTPTCTDASAGERWRPFALWIVAPEHDAVPPGYVAAGETPIEDLRAKLRSVEIVIDAGSRRARTVTVAGDDAFRTDHNFGELEHDAPPLPMAAFMPALAPLPVGDHTVDIALVLDDMHCDGLAPSIEDNCLPAGRVPFARRLLTIHA